jgi:hypothetical protein
MEARKNEYVTSGNQIAEAFLWKTGENLAPDGACGLVVLAMTWFKKEGAKFRQQFFAHRRVWCLANFANLAYLLFAGRTERPASVVFFEREKPADDDVIVSFAPFVAEQVANRPEKPRRRLFTWNIVVGANDVREVENGTAKRGESTTWKIAMWGTSRDRKLLARIDERFKNESFDSLARLGIQEPRQGFELRNYSAPEREREGNENGSKGKTKGPLEHRPELAGKRSC